MDPILVELVGQQWWQSLLPVIAILISLASIALTLILKFRDDARVSVSSSLGVFVGGVSGRPHVSLTATNVGRTGTTVLTSLHLGISKGVSLYMPRPISGATPLPLTLEPGASAHQFIPLSEIQQAVRESGLDPMKLIVVASTGHGERTYALSKQVRKALAA
ncbi:hypothetical protein [Arthrobacter sedimenti]|uniref:Uncharacterized protein n=1 Tax=Arthrobacter sedimenti TaxID=2694931 RepID=A0ABV8WHY2_9MICC